MPAARMSEIYHIFRTCQEVETKDGALKIILADLGLEWMVEMIGEAAEEVIQRASP